MLFLGLADGRELSDAAGESVPLVLTVVAVPSEVLEALCDKIEMLCRRMRCLLLDLEGAYRSKGSSSRLIFITEDD